MSFSIKNLFKKSNSVAQQQVQPLLGQQAPTNPNDRRLGETYQNWGIRMCATVAGSVSALAPMLQKAFLDEYNAQAQNAALQQQFRSNIQSQIQQKQNDVANINSQVEKEQDTIQTKKDIIKQHQEQIKQLKELKETKNKDEVVKFRIGLLILLPLTFYLILFYSSTFYSAFLESGIVSDVTNAMFNPKAFPNAWSKSIFSFLMMILFPIIFMGLGFNLHYFAKDKGILRYFKLIAILLVTFAFDCILAYKIGEKIYNGMVMNGIIPDGVPYTISAAMKDVSFWAVIFCGFIAYIIWGLVFDQIMSAYSKLDLNKVQIRNLEKNILGLESDIESLGNSITNHNSQIATLQNEITELEANLTNRVNINYAVIRREMTNFFTGWITQMNVLGISAIEQTNANSTFSNSISTLIPQQQ